MLDSSLRPHDLPLFSVDLEILRGVLHAVCRERGWEPGGSQSDHIGRVIIELYRRGVKDDAKLQQLARAYF